MYKRAKFPKSRHVVSAAGLAVGCVCPWSGV